MDSLEATSGTNIKPDVTVTLKSKGKKYTKKSTGDGPVDACYKAIDSIAKVKGKLLDYSIRSVTQGKDALGEVAVKVEINGNKVITHGTSVDIVEASAKAYIDAINKVLSQKTKSKK